jgi:hypothetical protein
MKTLCKITKTQAKLPIIENKKVKNIQTIISPLPKNIR